MANHRSAEKRHRQNLKRNERNRQAKAAIRTTLKRASTAAASGDKDAAQVLAKKASSLLDKAAVHGILHKNTVQRTISRLYKSINAAQA